MGAQEHPHVCLRPPWHPQEPAVEWSRVGVSPKYTNDLEIEYGICKQDPYFEISEKKLQIVKNTEILGMFCPFLGTITYYPSRERNIHFVRSFVYLSRELKVAPGEQQTFGERRFFTGGLVIVLGSRGVKRKFSDFGSFLCG